jgi:hypothetical protein
MGASQAGATLTRFALKYAVNKMAGVGGLEPTTLGFGDRCSTN